MPGYSTHYVCGVLAYRKINSGRIKECIKRYKRSYAVGLAGPDIFFYCIPDILPEHSHGVTLHEERTGIFLQNLFRETSALTGEKRKIAEAYFTGFVGHYMLDASCHPLVYEIAEDKDKRLCSAKHFMYESAMDEFACRRYLKRGAVDLTGVTAGKLSRQEREVITGLWVKVFRNTYEAELSYFHMKTVLFFFRTVSFLIKDKKGYKEKFLGAVEKKLLGFAYISPLFVNGNTYGFNKFHWEAFNKLFLHGESDFIETVPFIEKACNNDKEADRLFGILGNRSYHTGEDC